MHAIVAQYPNTDYRYIQHIPKEHPHRCAHSSLLPHTENGCDYPPQPENGYNRCYDMPSDKQKMKCIVSCRRGYGFTSLPPRFYLCNKVNGEWYPRSMIPDCAGQQTRLPGVVVLTMYR